MCSAIYMTGKISHQTRVESKCLHITVTYDVSYCRSFIFRARGIAVTLDNSTGLLRNKIACKHSHLKYSYQ